jgi:hypothetical protein
MPIKLLAHVWRTATAGGGLEPARPVHGWALELREVSQWNGVPAVRSTEPFVTPEIHPAEPVWSDTQPWCHP